MTAPPTELVTTIETALASLTDAIEPMGPDERRSTLAHLSRVETTINRLADSLAEKTW